MSVYKRGRTWWYKFTFQGKRYQASTHLKNRVQAANVEAKLRTDLSLGLYGLQPTRPGPFFKDYAESFRNYVQTHSKDRPETIAFYSEKLRPLLAFAPIANCRLNFIDEAVIEAYIQHRLKTVVATTVNNELATLRRALRVARKTLKVMTAAPEVTLLPGQSERSFVLNSRQEAAYLAACQDNLRDAAMLMLDTGLRVGECVRVQWTDFNEGWLRLFIRRGKTENAPRGLPLSARCREMLSNRRAFYPTAVWVFPGRKDHLRPGTLQGHHVRARSIARLEDGSELPAEFVIHSLRHTFATRFGELEPNAFLVKEVLGHGDIRMSQKYVHPQSGAIELAFERLEAYNRLMRGEEKAGDVFRDSRAKRPVKD